MRTSSWSPQKCESLRRHASLNLHPEQVDDLLFHTHPFFDPCDRVQVKYEMLRRVLIEGKPVEITVAAFGFSHVRSAQLRKRFEEDGLAGLLPQRRGPQGSLEGVSVVHKATPPDLKDRSGYNMVTQRLRWPLGSIQRCR